MSLKDESVFGPRARGVTADTPCPVTRTQDACIRAELFPEFAVAAWEHSHGRRAPESPERKVRFELFMLGYEAFRIVAEARGKDGSFRAFLEQCREGMRVGSAKYGVDWPFCDGFVELAAECRDVGVYAFLDELKELLESGGLARFGVQMEG